MKKSYLFVCILPFLAGCAGSSSSVSSSSIATSAATSEATSEATSQVTSAEATSGQEGEKYLFYKIKEGQSKDGLTGSPWLNVMAPGVVSKIEKPSLKDDFFVATNYDYLSTATLKEGQIADGGTIGAMNTIQSNYEALGKGEAKQGNYAAAIKKGYELMNSKDKSKDIAAVAALIKEVKEINSKENFIKFVTSVKGNSFAMSIFEIIKQENGALIYDNNMGWTIDGTIYKLDEDITQKEALMGKLAGVLTYFGIEANEAKVILEKGLAKEADLRNTSGIAVSQNGYTVAELKTEISGLDLGSLFVALGYKDTDKIKIDSKIFSIFSNIASTDATQLEDLKDDLIVRICLGAKTALPFDQYKELATIFDSGTRGYSDDMFVRDAFVESMRTVFDRAYIDNYETKERKQMLLSFMSDIKTEYKTILDNVSWLGSTTKAKAKTKLDKMSFDCCYPDHLLQIPEFNVSETVDNYFSLQNSYREWVLKANQPAAIRPELWAGSITTMNAFYFPDRNSFLVYDGIIANNTYKADQFEELLASVGWVVGHEISHSFDNNGRHYDEDGVQTDWWTKEDSDAFNARAAKVVEAWNKISYKDGLPMWSEKMLGEIIADMGGMSVILELAKKKADFDYVKFFNAFAASQASVISPMFIEEMFYNAQDEHPMNYLRVNQVLNQFPKFHSTFGISEGDLMYVKPSDSLVIW